MRGYLALFQLAAIQTISYLQNIILLQIEKLIIAGATRTSRPSLRLPVSSSSSAVRAFSRIKRPLHSMVVKWRAMSDPSFIHLRLHSEYSIVDGIVRIDDAVASAVADRMPAFARRPMTMTEDIGRTSGIQSVAFPDKTE